MLSSYVVLCLGCLAGCPTYAIQLNTHPDLSLEDSLARKLRGNDMEWFTGDKSSNPHKGAKIAVAYRGSYIRHGTFGGQEGGKGVCSDWWYTKDNIVENIVLPLQEAGAEVRSYFHTWSDTACPSNDKRLAHDMNASDYKIEKFEPAGNREMANMGYSYLKAFEMASKWADYVILVRFDVVYFKPITSLNIKWDTLSVASRGLIEPENRLNDLLFVVPAKYFKGFDNVIATCQGTLEQHINIEFEFEADYANGLEFNQNCLQAIEGEIGRKNLHFIDPVPRKSASFSSFLFIERHCPEAC